MSGSESFIVRSDITYRDVYNAWIAVRIIYKSLRDYIFVQQREQHTYFGMEFLVRLKKVKHGYLLLVEEGIYDDLIESCRLYIFLSQITLETQDYKSIEEGCRVHVEYMTTFLDQLNFKVHANIQDREHLIDWVLALNRKCEEIIHQKIGVERSHLDGTSSPLPLWWDLVEPELPPSEQVIPLEEAEDEEPCVISQGLKAVFLELYGSYPE